MTGTDTEVRIARIAAADLGAYKRLRDEALRLHPDAFDADIESEQSRPPESYLWRLGMSETLGGTFLLGAGWDGVASGRVVAGLLTCPLRLCGPDSGGALGWAR